MVQTKSKYLLAFLTPALVFLSLMSEGLLAYSVVLYAFVFIPLLEAFLPLSQQNLNEIEKGILKKERYFDWLLYLLVPTQVALLVLFLWRISQPHLGLSTQIGYLLSFGTACGVMGINLGHELGHRRTKYEKLMAKLLLSTSLYAHFFIEHNRGHHVHIGTPEDSATAKLNQSVYSFLLQAIFGGFVSAWRLEKSRLQRSLKPVWSWHNELLRMLFFEATMLAAIVLFFGWQVGLWFMGAAFFGAVLLECAEYIEHYGLVRKKLDNGNYERQSPAHSWNSNHPIGRMILFELPRHSHHHMNSIVKYQCLDHVENSPELPYGYPASILLSLIPPLWYRKMNPILDSFR